MIEITRYAPRHFDGVDALWREAFPGDPPRNDAAVAIPEKLALQPDWLLVALENDAVVGSIMAGHDGHRGWISRIAVAISHRRAGIGGKLVREAERLLIEVGCPKINLQVITSNATVVVFYERLGYRVEERISMGKVIK